MASKIYLSFYLVILSLCTISCGLRTGEKNATPEVAKVKSAQCLNQAVSDLKVYFKGDATDDQVTNSFECLQDVFVAFKENIRGQNKDSYTPREIATFIEINFLKQGDAPFTDSFLNELMLFKVALFGGGKDIILKSEIDQIVDFVARFKIEFVRLNPYMKILTLNWKDQYLAFDESSKETQFLAAKDQFQKFILKLSLEFARGGREYKIDDLIGFVTEVLRFAKIDEKTIGTVEKASPFLKKFKLYLIGGVDSLKGDEWQKIGLTLHEAYFQSLRFQYFLKILDPKQIEQRWIIYEKIATDLSTLIENLLKTKQTQMLTNKEIFELLQPLSQIIPQAGLTEDLLNELGDIKVMILGDSQVGRRGWEKSDFEILNKKIPTLFKNLASLIETIDYLSLKKDGTFRSRASYDEFLAAEVKILTAVNNLGQLVEKSYDLQSLKALLENLSNGPFQGTLKLPDNFEHLFKAFISGKFLLTGQEDTIVSVENIKLLLNVGIRAYLNYSEYDLFLSEVKFESVNFMLALERLWPKIKTTIQTELNLKSDKIIKTTELTQFIQVLQNEKILKTHISESSLNILFDALWSNILNKPEDRINSIFRKGFDLVGFEQLTNEVEIWLEVQKNMAQIFQNSATWAKNEILPELDRRVENEKNEMIKAGLADIKFFLNQQIPLTLNDQGFLQILTLPSGAYHQHDLTESNLARALARLIIRSYANNLQRVTQLAGVQKDEVLKAYDQFKPLAVDLDIIDKSNMNFMSSRFLEANLFLSVSDGDQLASYIELHHLIIHLFSGIKRASDIKPQLIKNCVSPLMTVYNSQTEADEDCVLNEFMKNINSYVGLPEFLNMRNQFKPEEIKDYYLSLLKTAGYVPNERKTVLLSDADLFPHVVQYIEMVYARNDLNHDNLLQKDEALAAFPVFKNLLKDLVKSYSQIHEEDLPGVFIYILKYGRPPKKNSIGELLKFVIFIKDKTQKNWNINSTRIDLGKIFNYIADETKPTSPTEPGGGNVTEPEPLPGTSNLQSGSF